VYHGGLAAELDVFDDKGCGAGLGAAEEVEVEGYGVRLGLFRERGGEVQACYAHEDGGDIAAVGDWMLFSEGLDYVRLISVDGRECTCTDRPGWIEVDGVCVRIALVDGGRLC